MQAGDGEGRLSGTPERERESNIVTVTLLLSFPIPTLILKLTDLTWLDFYVVIIERRERKAEKIKINPDTFVLSRSFLKLVSKGPTPINACWVWGVFSLILFSLSLYLNSFITTKCPELRLDLDLLENRFLSVAKLRVWWENCCNVVTVGFVRFLKCSRDLMT